MASTQEAREARRRKIMARGADRMAFILGEAPSVPSSATTTTASPHAAPADDTTGAAEFPSPVNGRSGDAALFRLLDGGLPELPYDGDSQQHLDTQIDSDDHAKVLEDENEERRYCDQDTRRLTGLEFLESLQPGTRQSQEDVRPTSSRVLHAQEDSKPTNSIPLHVQEDVMPTRPSQLSDSRGLEFRSGLPPVKSSTLFPGFVKSLISAIDATENYRVIGAISLALFFIAQSLLSCLRPCGTNLSNLVVPWPTALVLVMDIALVSGAQLLGFAKTSGRNGDVDEFEERPNALKQAFDMALKLGNALDVGTLFFKTSQALFLDCGVYILVLTIGYSFARICKPTLCTLASGTD